MFCAVSVEQTRKIYIKPQEGGAKIPWQHSQSDQRRKKLVILFPNSGGIFDLNQQHRVYIFKKYLYPIFPS